jgi:hypothetical protein
LSYSGSVEAVHVVTVKIMPDVGEAIGALVTGSAINIGNGLHAVPLGTGTVSRGGDVLATFTGAPAQDAQQEFQARIGDTLVIRSAAVINAAEEGENDFAMARSQLRVGLVPVAPEEVQVTAKYDSDPAGNVFGTYFTNVSLVNKFTINVPSTDTKTRQFRFTIEGSLIAPKLVARKPGGTTVKIEMGQLPAQPDGAPRSYPLTVEALDGKKVQLARFEGVIVVNGRLGLDLAVSALGDSAGPRPVEKARLIAGVKIDPKLVYHPTITGEVPAFYSNKFALSFYEPGTSKLKYHHPIASISGGQGSMAKAINANLYRDDFPNPADFDYDIVLTAATLHRVGKTYHKFSGAEKLRVILIPDWLKKNAVIGAPSRYGADADTAPIYGQGGAAYQFAINSGPKYDIKLPETSKGPFDLLEGLANKVKLSADFTVYAGLFDDQPAKVVADRVELFARLLGEPLFDVDLDPATLPVTMESPLDARSLSEPDKVTIGTAGAVNLLPLFSGPLKFEKQFGPWKLDVPVFNLLWVASIDATVRLSGKFTASVQRLDLTGSLTFDFAEGKILPDLTRGTFALDFDAIATAALKAGAAVSVNVIGYRIIDLASINATGAITFDLTGRVSGTFGGKDGFTLDKDEEDTFLDLDVAYAFTYNVNFLTKDPDDDALPPDEKTAEDSDFASIWDF